MPLPFTILQAPKHSLRGIAGNREICNLGIAEILLLHINTTSLPRILLPPIRDGIPGKQNIEIAIFCGFDKAIVTFGGAHLSLDGSDGGVGPWHGDVNQIAYFFNTALSGEVLVSTKRFKAVLILANSSAVGR